MSKFTFNRIKTLFLRITVVFSVAFLSFFAFSACSKSATAQNDPEKPQPIILTNSQIGPLPSISASSAILIEAGTKTVIGAKNADARLPMASTTKIMSALVAIENADISKTVAVSAQAIGVEGSSIYLYEGEKLTLEDLIYAMMLESANDAAAAIAIEVGRSIEGFAEMMNKKAKELGLENTSFQNPHGLDCDLHYTTAHDLAIIAVAAMENPTFQKIVSTYKKTIPLNETEGVRLLINHNKLLKGYDGAVGIKTGYTKKSGRCLVSAAEKDGVKLICVTLNAPDDWRDHSNMLDYGFSLFESRLLCSDGEFSYTLPIVGGDKDYITVKNHGDLRVILKRGAQNVECRVCLPRFAFASIEEGDELGRLVYYYDGKEIGSVPLTASFGSDRIIYKKSFFEKLLSLFSK